MNILGLCKDDQQTPCSERASRRPPSNSVHPLCSESQEPRPTGEEVENCVPDHFQLQPCIDRGGKESPRDQHPNKGAQSCHQTGRYRKVGQSTTHLVTASPNTVGGNQCVDQAKNNTTLLIKEALHIRLTNFELFNMNDPQSFLLRNK